jgi:hypothetical protein
MENRDGLLNANDISFCIFQVFTRTVKLSRIFFQYPANKRTKKSNPSEV